MIENFIRKKLKQNFVIKMLSRRKNAVEIARYREMLRRLLDTYGLASVSPNVFDSYLIIFSATERHLDSGICARADPTGRFADREKSAH